MEGGRLIATGTVAAGVDNNNKKKKKKDEFNSNSNSNSNSKVGGFYAATLLMWAVSVGFEILSNKKTQLVVVPSAFLFFQTANFILRRYVSREPLLVNTCVSLLHSSLTSSFVVFILLRQWVLNQSLERMLEHEELVNNTWGFAYTALCISCGYFAYDQWDMLKYRLYSSSCCPSILAHHLILLLCFTLALYRNLTINYLILTLFCELHSVFLHVRKIRRMAGVRNAESAVVKAEWILNWVTFIGTRFIPHALILIKLVRDASKFNKGIELPLACFGMIGMNALNVGLGIDLLGAYKRETTPQIPHID